MRGIFGICNAYHLNTSAITKLQGPAVTTEQHQELVIVYQYMLPQLFNTNSINYSTFGKVLVHSYGFTRA